MATSLDSFYIRFYRGDDQDEAIARHLSQFDDAPRGAKPDEAKRLMHLGLQIEMGERKTLDRDAIRAAVREALGETQAALIDALSSPPRGTRGLDPATVRRVVQEAMRDAVEEIGVKESVFPFNLADIRRVVDAALQEQLGRWELSSAVQKPDDGEAHRVEDLLSKFDASAARWGKGES